MSRLLQEIHVAGCSQYGDLEGTSTQTNAPRLVALDDSLESLAAAESEEEVLDRRRALDRLHTLIRKLKPLDCQVMLLYLEQLDAASIAEITGLSAANVATKARRIKQLLIQRFHSHISDERTRRKRVAQVRSKPD